MPETTPARGRHGATKTRPAPQPGPSGDLLRSIVEALAYAAEEPLSLDELVELYPGTSRQDLESALEGLERDCESAHRGLRLMRIAGGCRLVTKAELGEHVRALFRARNRRRLSAQALETLAIIAYRQPITTPEIQAVRGADPAGVLDTLLEKRLVRILGRKKVVGKPLLYGTTPEFLAHFGLNSLEDLPSPEEFGGLMTRLAGAGPEGSPAKEREATPATDRRATGPFEEEDEDTYEDVESEDVESEEDDGEEDDDGDDS